jgi:hypothetical protein
MRQLPVINRFLSFIIVSLFLLSGCEKKDNIIIDSTGTAPVLTEARFSLSLVNTDTIDVGSERKPDDLLTIRGRGQVSVIHPDGTKGIGQVGYSMTSSQSSSLIVEGTLQDDGIFPDAIANDDVYSGFVSFQIRRVEVGQYSIVFWSESQTGFKSNTIILPLSIVRLNQPPIISDLVTPDTINILDQLSFKISLKVIDPNGQDDIKSVMRFTPSGKVLKLFAKNDSVYTETVEVDPTTSIGPYLFRFCAVDRSNDTSNVLTKTIVIVN